MFYYFICFDSMCKFIEGYTEPSSSFSCGYILNIVNISAIFQAEGNSHNIAPSKSSRSKGKAGISGKVDSADNLYSFIFLCLKSPRSLPCKQILRRVSQFYEVFLLILAVIIVPCPQRNYSHRLLVFIRYLNQ